MSKIILLIMVSILFIGCSNNEPTTTSQNLSKNKSTNKYKLIEEFPDGSKLVEYQLEIAYINNGEARLNVTTAGVTFEDSTLNKIIPLNNKSNSIYKYRLVMNKGITNADHKIEIFQDNTSIAQSYLVH